MAVIQKSTSASKSSVGAKKSSVKTAKTEKKEVKTVKKIVSKVPEEKVELNLAVPSAPVENSMSQSSSVQDLVGKKVVSVSEPVARPIMPPVSAPVRKPTPTAPGAIEYVGGRKVWRSSGNVVERPQPQNGFAGEVDGRIIPDAGVPTEEFRGILDMMRDGNGILRSGFSVSDRDAYISGTQIRRFRLKPGDEVTGPARKPKENEQYWGLLKVERINGIEPDKMETRIKFESLTPVYPDEKIVLETDKEILSTRLIDLVAPVGRGQRGMIVSPPKAGKTTVLKDIATGVATNYKDIHVMAVLIGERPEEVTDIKRHIDKVTGGTGEVAASNFDEQASEQVRVAELALERAKRLVEVGRHVVIIMDSITRMARAYNLAIPTSGRTLSGGFDPAALYPPKRFFGAARNFESFDTVGGKKNGSLTILGTALIDTGSKMDDLIYEEFKGTGNMELHLDRKLAERRIYPSIDIQRSGTRREDLLFTPTEYQSLVMMRRMIDMLDPKEHTQVIINRMKGTKNNKEFLATLKEG